MFSFFFHDTATTEIYTLSLHDALPIYARRSSGGEDVAGHERHHRAEVGDLLEDVVDHVVGRPVLTHLAVDRQAHLDRKSTRLNSSHGYISYAVFCLKKKKKINQCKYKK